MRNAYAFVMAQSCFEGLLNGAIYSLDDSFYQADKTFFAMTEINVLNVARLLYNELKTDKNLRETQASAKDLDLVEEIMSMLLKAFFLTSK